MRDDFGIGLQSIAIDCLHTISTGIYSTFCGKTVQDMISADLYNVGARPGSKVKLSVQRLREELFVFYDQQEKMGNTVHRVADLAAETFGSRTSPACKLKAAHTNTFLAFLVQKLSTCHKRLPQGNLALQVGQALLTLTTAPKTGTFTLTTPICQAWACS